MVVNGYKIPSDATYAVGRFRPDGLLGFRARDVYVENAALRPTRDEAIADVVAALLAREVSS